MQPISKNLRRWFLFHFWVDLIFALPLILAPVWFMGLFDFEVTETLTPRLVGAALLGIGGASLVMHKAGLEAFKTMLQLKIIWSGAAMLAILLTYWQEKNAYLWLFFSIFFTFSMVWNYYFFRESWQT